MGLFPGSGLSVGEMVPGRGRSQERGVCVSRGSPGWPGVTFSAEGARMPSPRPLPVNLCSLRLGKRFVERRPRRWGWGKDRLGLPASLPVPQPCGSKCRIRGPGTPGAYPDTAFLVPNPEGPGPGTPQASPAIRETGPRWVFINPQPSEGSARTYPSAQLEAAGLLCRRAEAWEPLWALPQPGDLGPRLASLDPSISLKGRSVRTRCMRVCPWPRSAASLWAGQV